MSDRLEIRPFIKGLNTNNIGSEEQFQNETLRPIIKLQHDLLVAYFKAYLVSKKCKFKEFSELKRIAFIEAAFQKDNAFKSELKGIIIGQFTTKEFEFYSKNKSDFNKRILKMIQQRITSFIDLF